MLGAQVSKNKKRQSDWFGDLIKNNHYYQVTQDHTLYQSTKYQMFSKAL